MTELQDVTEQDGTTRPADLAVLNAVDCRKVALRTLERIDAFPQTHDQQHWLAKDGIPLFERSGAVLWEALVDWPCGTTACVAGHAVAAAGELYPDLFGDGWFGLVDVPTAAVRLLGLTSTLRAGDWPNVFGPTAAKASVVEFLEAVAAGVCPDDADSKVPGWNAAG